MTLPPLVGHREARRLLLRALEAGRVPTSLLIQGPAGVGKQRFALWLARLLVCREPHGDGPCGACQPCRLALNLEHPDIHWYFPLPRPKGTSRPEKLREALEEARMEAIAGIREEPLRPRDPSGPRGLYLQAAQTIRSKAHRRPAMGDRQVFIVADAEHLVPQESSPEAANALLKVLEEPPEGTTLILTSSEPGRLLPTIRSRTLPLRLGPLSLEETEAFLVEEAGVDPGAASQAAELSGGCIGRALGFLPGDGEEEGPLEESRQRARALLRAALAPEGGRMHATALDYPPAGARELLDVFAFVGEWVRDMAAASVGATGEVLNADAAEALAEVSRSRPLDPIGASEAMHAVEEARELASGNVNPQLIVFGLLRRLRRALEGSAERAAGEGGGGR